MDLKYDEDGLRMLAKLLLDELAGKISSGGARAGDLAVALKMLSQNGIVYDNAEVNKLSSAMDDALDLGEDDLPEPADISVYRKAKAE